MSEVPTVIVMLGALLFLTAIFGGGITLKEVTIPSISRRLRLFLFPLSIFLMAFGIWIAFVNPFQGLKGAAAEQTEAASSANLVPMPTSIVPPSRTPWTAFSLETVDDFEGIDTKVFENYQDETGTVVTCTIDRQVVHGGGASWRLHWEVVADGWGYCLHSYYSQGSADWSRGRGVSFWYTADTAGQSIAFWMHISDSGDGTGYGTFFDTTVESTAGWEYVEVPWEKFTLLPWEEQALVGFDPSKVNSYGFTIAGSDKPIFFNMRVDDVALLMA